MEVNKNLENISLAPSRVPNSLTRWVEKVSYWLVQEPQDILGTLRSEEFTEIFKYSKVWWQVLAVAFLASRGLFKFNLKVPYAKFQQSIFKRDYVFNTIPVGLTQMIRPNLLELDLFCKEISLSLTIFGKNDGDFRRIMFQ